MKLRTFLIVVFLFSSFVAHAQIKRIPNLSTAVKTKPVNFNIVKMDDINSLVMLETIATNQTLEIEKLDPWANYNKVSDLISGILNIEANFNISNAAIEKKYGELVSKLAKTESDLDQLYSKLWAQYGKKQLENKKISKGASSFVSKIVGYFSKPSISPKPEYDDVQYMQMMQLASIEFATKFRRMIGRSLCTEISEFKDIPEADECIIKDGMFLKFAASATEGDYLKAMEAQYRFLRQLTSISFRQLMIVDYATHKVFEEIAAARLPNQRSLEMFIELFTPLFLNIYDESKFARSRMYIFFNKYRNILVKFWDPEYVAVNNSAEKTVKPFSLYKYGVYLHRDSDDTMVLVEFKMDKAPELLPNIVDFSTLPEFKPGEDTPYGLSISELREEVCLKITEFKDFAIPFGHKFVSNITDAKEIGTGTSFFYESAAIDAPDFIGLCQLYANADGVSGGSGGGGGISCDFRKKSESTEGLCAFNPPPGGYFEPPDSASTQGDMSINPINSLFKTMKNITRRADTGCKAGKFSDDSPEPPPDDAPPPDAPPPDAPPPDAPPPDAPPPDAPPPDKPVQDGKDGKEQQTVDEGKDIIKEQAEALLNEAYRQWGYDDATPDEINDFKDAVDDCADGLLTPPGDGVSMNCGGAGCVLYDAEGNIIDSGSLDINDDDSDDLMIAATAVYSPYSDMPVVPEGPLKNGMTLPNGKHVSGAQIVAHELGHCACARMDVRGENHESDIRVATDTTKYQCAANSECSSSCVASGIRINGVMYQECHETPEPVICDNPLVDCHSAPTVKLYSSDKAIGSNKTSGSSGDAAIGGDGASDYETDCMWAPSSSYVKGKEPTMPAGPDVPYGGVCESGPCRKGGAKINVRDLAHTRWGIYDPSPYSSHSMMPLIMKPSAQNKLYDSGKRGKTMPKILPDTNK